MLDLWGFIESWGVLILILIGLIIALIKLIRIEREMDRVDKANAALIGFKAGHV